MVHQKNLSLFHRHSFIYSNLKVSKQSSHYGLFCQVDYPDWGKNDALGNNQKQKLLTKISKKGGIFKGDSKG